ncbi:MAG: endonuclease MutS2 [Dehalococcoidia bacterium]|nr:endonuclease MutS2 [Dehalococcoidia bacterium]MDD5494675.1 endonuclease MutS2 [Dehalococcoidia bacterium]
MDNNTLEMLEFPRVRERLAHYTSFSAGRELALALEPTSDIDLVILLLKQSAEARKLLSIKPDFHISEAYDVREDVMRAEKGVPLDPQTLLKVLKTMAAARLARSGLGRMTEELPALWAVVRDISVQSELEGEISRCISPAGEIMDSASPRLANLRWQLRESRRHLQERLAGIVKSKKGQTVLQEPLITERNGRYVLPVKAELKKELKGIVHDISNTGATVFIEPLETVEVGNELRQAEIEERQEIERILAALSASIGASGADILHNINILARLDLVLAKAFYAEKIKAIEPEISVPAEGARQSLILVNARHPLLRGEAVPLNVEIGHDFSILIISGPNAGGKTVALKTVGLLVSMAQSGLPIPCAEGTCMPVFDAVFADIGDEQSIEQTLSTFSAHINNISRIVKTTSPRSLVLLDELGISTDPEEGAALAQAVLLHFLGKGTMVVVTTHYSQLKAFAHLNPGLRNASLDFDPVTLMPTYKLRVGMPGGSNALNIATRFGLPQEIVTDARSIMSKGSQEVEAMLSDLTAEQKRLEDLHASLKVEETRARELTGKLEDEIARLKEKERDLLREIQDNLNKEIAGLYRAIREAEAELKKQRNREKIEQSKKALEKISSEADKHNKELAQKLADIKGSDEAAAEIAAGDSVRIRDMDIIAEVISVHSDDGRLEVQTGDIRLTLNAGSVEKLESLGPAADIEKPVIRPRTTRPASPELDLRGKRADLVGAHLDTYLNDAFMSHLMEVRVIHGYGTGAVRNAVREFLQGHALVKSFRPGGQGEGGDGVTVVRLA